MDSRHGLLGGCSVRPCGFPLHGRSLLCGWHWRMVPEPLQHAVALACGPTAQAAARAAAIAAVCDQVTANGARPVRSGWDDDD